MRFAAQTTVSVARSRAEIEDLLERYKAEKIMIGRDESRAVIGFAMNRRLLRFELPLPNPNDKQFGRSPGGRVGYGPEERLRAWEQGCRQRWRALLLAIKAKLESVECGIETFEQAFLAHIVVPGTGRTMGEHLIPQLEQLTDSKGVPQLPGF